jgi:hypothetical protein
VRRTGRGDSQSCQLLTMLIVDGMRRVSVSMSLSGK